MQHIFKSPIQRHRYLMLHIAIKDQHSEADVQKDVDNFLLANGSKLLETIPQSYFEFLDFFYKSQKGGYTQIPQNAEM